MKKLLGTFKAGQKGFTLIELLVAIAILGILAAVAIPQVSKFLDQASSKAAKTELSMVQVAVVAYEAEFDGAVPATVSDLDEYLAGGSAALNGVYVITAGTGVVSQTTYNGVAYP